MGRNFWRLFGAEPVFTPKGDTDTRKLCWHFMLFINVKKKKKTAFLLASQQEQNEKSEGAESRGAAEGARE